MKTNFSRITFLLLITCWLTCSAYGQSWQPLNPGASGQVSSGGAGFTSLAFDANGVLYLAYRDYANDNKATVRKFSGGSWSDVGQAGFSEEEAYYTNIAVDADGTPYVAYMNDGENGKATVMKFNGSNWVPLGTAVTTGGAAEIALVLDAQGFPYVIYRDNANGSRATVRKFDGSSWVDVGGAGFSDGEVRRPSIKIDASGNPFVAYEDYGSGYKAIVKQYDGQNWVTVGPSDYVTSWENEDIYTRLALTLDANGNPFVAYKDKENRNRVTVKKLNGNSWEEVGAPGFSAGSATFVTIAFDANGIPYVGYADTSNGLRATVMKFDGSSWVIVGAPGFSAGGAWYISLGLDATSMPFIAYADDRNDWKATVMRFADAPPAAPTAIGAASCGPGTVILSATGAAEGSYRWYTTSNGGEAIPSATGSTYTTPYLTSSTTYYAAVVSGAYESERTAVVATIASLPAAPVVTAAIPVCQGIPAAALTATGNDLKWYTVALGGTASTTPPTPGTSAAGFSEYYVSQTVNGCESERAKIIVTVFPAPIFMLDACAKTMCSTTVEGYTLTGGWPLGGTYSGTGVSNGVFHPSAAGIGTHTISYTYSSSGCTTTATQAITVTTCTDKEEESKLNSRFLLFPNPTDDELQLIVPLAGNTALELRLFDAKGQAVLKQTYSQLTNELNEVLNVRDKAPGVYLLQLITGDEVITKRVVIK